MTYGVSVPDFPGDGAIVFGAFAGPRQATAGLIGQRGANGDTCQEEKR